MGMNQRQYRSPFAGMPIILKQWAVPAGIAPSGSIGNNGALTLGTALPFAYPGVWLYLPADAIAVASAAGWYWCKMTSTTVGTVYNTVLDGITQVPYRPATDVPFVTTGPGAFTGVTSTVRLLDVTIPGGMMRRNGRAVTQFLRSNNNSAQAKVAALWWNGVEVSPYTNTNNTGGGYQYEIANSGSTQLQMLSPWGYSSVEGQFARTPFTASANTDADVALGFRLWHATATDVVMLDSAIVQVIPLD